MASRPQMQADDPMDSVRDESSQDQPIMERVSNNFERSVSAISQRGQPIMESVSKSFMRSVSAISQRGQSIKESISAYAEELEDYIEPKIGDYHSPELNVIENVVEEESQADGAKPDEDAIFVDNEEDMAMDRMALAIAKTMMAEKGVALTPEKALAIAKAVIADYQSPEVNVMDNVVEKGDDYIEPKIGDYQSPEENVMENVVKEGDDEDPLSIIDSIGGCGALSSDEMEPQLGDYQSTEENVMENVVKEGDDEDPLSTIDSIGHTGDYQSPEEKVVVKLTFYPEENVVKEDAVFVDNEEDMAIDRMALAIAKTMMAEKGIVFPPEKALAIAKAVIAGQRMAAEKKVPEKKVKKHKRPRLAKWSKILFRKRKELPQLYVKD